MSSRAGKHPAPSPADTAAAVSVPVLMYHSTRDHPPRSTKALSVHTDAFGQQLRRLREQGFTGITFGELCARRRTGVAMPGKPVVITFDDGYADFYEEAVPALVEHGFPATVFVTTGWLRDAGRHAAGPPPDRMMSWSELAELTANGIEVGAHSHSHPQLDQIPHSQLGTELRDTRSMLEDLLGQPVLSLAYPYGYSNVRVRASAQEAGYLQAAGVTNTAAGPGAEPFRVPRLTVRRSTSARTFADVSDLAHLRRHYAFARSLTAGWAVVRAGRSVVRRFG